MRPTRSPASTWMSMPSRATMPAKRLVMPWARSTVVTTTTPTPAGAAVSVASSDERPSGSAGSGARPPSRPSSQARPCTRSPSGWRAYWMVPRPKRMKRQSAASGKTSGMASSSRRIQPRKAPFSTTASNRANIAAAVMAPARLPGREGHDQHQPEEGGQRREVAAVVHVLLVDRQHAPRRARRRSPTPRRPPAGCARARCRSTARPPRCRAGRAACGRWSPG